MATLTLKNKPQVKPDPLECILLDEVPDRAEFNATLSVPTHKSATDYSNLPPPGERASAPVQVGAKTWGNPRLLQPDARPGPQPLSVPPRGR